MKQLFGYTGPDSEVGGVAPYAMAFEREDGALDLTVRRKDGMVATCVMPASEASRLFLSLAPYAVDKPPPQNEITGSQFTPEEVRLDPVLQFLIPNRNLSGDLFLVAAEFECMARMLLDTLPRNAQRTMALNSLVTAKDQAVRAKVPVPEWLK